MYSALPIYFPFTTCGEFSCIAKKLRYKNVQECFKFIDEHSSQFENEDMIKYQKACCAYCFGALEKPPMIPKWTPPETESPGIIQTMIGFYSSLGNELGQLVRKPFVSFLKSTFALEDKTAESIATPLMVGGAVFVLYVIFKAIKQKHKSAPKASKPKRKLKLRSPITFEEERRR